MLHGENRSQQEDRAWVNQLVPVSTVHCGENFRTQTAEIKMSSSLTQQKSHWKNKVDLLGAQNCCSSTRCLLTKLFDKNNFGYILLASVKAHSFFTYIHIFLQGINRHLIEANITNMVPFWKKCVHRYIGTRDPKKGSRLMDGVCICDQQEEILF